MDPVHLQVLSGMEIGLKIFAALWGIMTAQAATYYLRFKSDPLHLKIVVGISWLGNTIFLLLMAIGIDQCILLASSGTYDKLWPQAVAAGTLCACFTQYFVQALYVRRIYVMWGKLHIPLLCAIGTLYSFVTGVHFNAVTQNITLLQLAILEKESNWRVTSMFSVTAAEDIVITATLCYLLRRDRDSMVPRTLQMVDKLVTWTIETGMITSLLAVVVAVTASIKSISTRYPGVWLSISMVDITLYPLAYIFMLNGRTLLRSIGDDNVPNTFNSDILQSADANAGRTIIFSDNKGNFHSDRTTQTASEV